MRSWTAAAALYLDRRLILILALGFSSGLPLALVYATLSARLTEAEVSLATIGLFSWAGAAYSLKFLWSPLVDLLKLPVLSSWLGQRRAWLLLSQVAVIATILGLGAVDPATELWMTALWATLLAFASATQDIVIDAARVELLEQDEQAAGAGTLVVGYRIAMLASGGGALVIADLAGWTTAYWAMAGLMGIGVLAALLMPEPARPEEPAMPATGPATRRVALWLRKAVWAPLADFVARPRWLVIIAFVALYKYGDAMLGVMANPFYLDLGFTKTEIGLVSKSWGLIMTLAGGLLGGILVARIGLYRGLMVCGLLQAASNLVFAAQAAIGPVLPALVVTISVENLAGGMGTAAFVAYLSSLCNRAFTATQYALISSFMAMARTFLASGGGWLAGELDDWVAYFLICTLAAIPGLLLLLLLRPKDQPPASSS